MSFESDKHIWWEMFLQDGRIDYNEFVAMMQKSTVGFGKKGHQYNLSVGLRDALSIKSNS